MKYTSILTTLMVMSIVGHIDANCVIGGQITTGSTPSYGAIQTTSGSFISLTGPGFPLSANQVSTVDINQKNKGIIGTEDPSYVQAAYVGLVSPTGALTPVTGNLPKPSVILSVAINNSGTAVVGGQDLSISPAPPYLGIVSPSGVLTRILDPKYPISHAGIFYNVDINESGVALAVGTDGTLTTPYAVLVSPTGTLTELKVSPLFSGRFQACAINDSGIGIIGGLNYNSPPGPELYLLNASGTLTAIPTSLLPTEGEFYSAAINSKGMAIAGGYTDANTSSDPGIPYVCFISPDGTFSFINQASLPSEGNILSVDINEAGASIIGGFEIDSKQAYAAFISPSGIVNPISGTDFPTINGIINSVGINNQGVGIIGGRNLQTGNAYAAIVSPSGIATSLFGSNFQGNIEAVAIADLMAPSSIGSYNSPHVALLAASHALEMHTMIHHKLPWFTEKALETDSEKKASELGLLTSADSTLSTPPSSSKTPDYAIWAAPFYDRVRQKQRGTTFQFNNNIGGTLLGFEYRQPTYVVGAGLGFAGDGIKFYDSQRSRAQLNEEVGLLYTTFQWGNFFLNASLWGGGYQLKNHRNSILSITSKSKTHGWLLSPHLEFSMTPYRKAMQWLTAEPFIMFDWVNNWQKHYTEKGSSGFNLVVAGQYNSLLRGETGIRLYEMFNFSWGSLILEEKASYINMTPFQFKSQTTYFVGGAPSAFNVGIGSSSAYNLGGVECNISVVPNQNQYPFFTLNFQGEFGVNYQSYFGGLELGWKF